MSVIGSLSPDVFGKLTPNIAVERFRQLLLCEARHTGIRLDAITISLNINVSDGGIDADIAHDVEILSDSFLHSGRMGFQLKTGQSFKPWQLSSLKSELLSKSGDLVPEVRNVLEAAGHYVLVCFGIDFTPQQRNKTVECIAGIFASFGFDNTDAQILVLGQGHLAAYFDKFPSLRLALLGISDEGFLSVAEWSKHAHMNNQMVFSDAQQSLIHKIQLELRGDAKHLRVLGEPGIGKTRLVLEALYVDDLAPVCIYVPQGERFGQSIIFRDLLRDTPSFPLIIVIDELSERELTELWGHLKGRTGKLKLVTMDHGANRTTDSDIIILHMPRLEDDSIKKILASHVGENVLIDRWVAVCEGSPRVAQAVGANLAANPDDILRPPATVPFWDRFLHGYSKHDSENSAQTAIVMQHIALFSRFGFEAPVGDEARYIATLVSESDPSITWARFQKIIQEQRERRVIQGTRTLFIVPWALHIYLWRQYWSNYARGFDFITTLHKMPESLQGWFLEMFRYSHGSAASAVVKDILRLDGVFSDRAVLISRKGATFLEALTEADPDTSLSLLEHTIGVWSREDLLLIDDSRQLFVRILEMIAVWRHTTVRAMRLLLRLSLAENSKYSNNSTGIFLGLFNVGPEWAATEASPSERLHLLREVFRSKDTDCKLLALKGAKSALNLHGGMRIIGAEYQGLKKRAELWRPQTRDEWRHEFECYWNCLVDETRSWELELRSAANSAILSVLPGLLDIPQFEERTILMLQVLYEDQATDTHELNRFLSDQIWRCRDEDKRNLRRSLQKFMGRISRKNLASRFQRYVLDATWSEWENYEVKEDERENLRVRRLVRALAKRVANNRKVFDELLPLLVSTQTQLGSLFYFGVSLGTSDLHDELLDTLMTSSLKAASSQCIGGYLSSLKQRNPAKWQQILMQLLSTPETAVHGADLVWRTGFDSEIFNQWVLAYNYSWVGVGSFRILCLGMTWQQVPEESLIAFLKLLTSESGCDRIHLAVDLLDQLIDEEVWDIETNFVLQVVTSADNFIEDKENMHGFHWSRICEKLVKHDSTTVVELLDTILLAMGNNYRLTYDHYVEPTAHMLCKINPKDAWAVVSKHLLSLVPMWRSDILNWLKGGIAGFGGAQTKSPISELPLETILAWIDEDISVRASMMAHAAPGTLDDDMGGALTKALIDKYSNEEGVLSGISCNFHSGGWMGDESLYHRDKRDKFRRWLGNGFSLGISRWIENEVVYLDKRIEACEIEEEREPWNRPTS